MNSEKLNMQEEEVMDQEECLNDQLKAIFTRAEIGKGSYLTPFDRLVLEFLYKEPDPINTEELWMTLKKEGVKISIATVQLCLNRFYRCGVLERNKPEGEKKYNFSFVN